MLALDLCRITPAQGLEATMAPFGHFMGVDLDTVDTDSAVLVVYIS